MSREDRWSRRRQRVIACCLLFLFAAGPVQSQDDVDDEAAARVRASLEIRQKRNSLLGVIDAEKRATEQLRTLQRELAGAGGRGREAELIVKIQEVDGRLDDLDRNFAEISAGFDPRIFEEEQNEDVDFSSEIRELLGPLIYELRRMTSRPRALDRLRSSISESVEHLSMIERALFNVARLLEQIEDPAIREALLVEQAEWEVRQETARTELAVARQKLDRKENESSSITDTMQGVFRLFFKSRGRNLLLALLITVSFLVVLRRFHVELQKRGPLGRASPSFRSRLFNLLYAVFTVLGGLLVFLIVLYVFGDWVLLILVVMLIMGFVWASKQALPAFWTQATLLLDMGVVREGERLEYGGIPFQIESLGFYTQLLNPALSDGQMRLPLNDLTDLRSRPYGASERWFPTDEGDWVLLGGVLARVIHQGLDGVRVMYKGGALQTFPTADFPGQGAVVLSDGFRVSVTFGVDYQHQAIVTDEVVERMRRFLSDGLGASRHRDRVSKQVVEFQSAGASSLDLALMVDFEGEAATDYDEITRLVNRIAVDACNANGWVIPFQQVTLHMATSTTDPEAVSPGTTSSGS